MDKNQIRLALAGVAAFYVIVGGLFLQAYIPVARFDAAVEARVERGAAYDYDSDQGMNDALSYDGNVGKVGRYGGILLWGTVGLATFAGVVFFTRRKKQGERLKAD